MRDVIGGEGPDHVGFRYCGFLANFLNFRYFIGILLRIAVWPFFRNPIVSPFVIASSALKKSGYCGISLNGSYFKTFPQKTMSNLSRESCYSRRKR